MAGAHISIELDAKPQTDALGRAAEAMGGKVEPMMRDIGELLLNSHAQRFRDQVDPDGQRWAPLNPKYAKTKKRNKDQILVLDGILSGTLRYDASDQGLLFGTDRPQGARLHFGDDDMPERPWLGITDQDGEDILAIGEDFLLDAIRDR